MTTVMNVLKCNKTLQGTPQEEMEKRLESWLCVTDTTLLKKYKAKDTNYSAKGYFLNAGIILCSDNKDKINKRAHQALYGVGSKIYNVNAKVINETVNNFQELGEEMLVQACGKNADVLLYKLSEKDRALIIHNLFKMIRQAKKFQQEDEDLLEMLQDSLYVSDKILKNIFEDFLEEEEKGTDLFVTIAYNFA